MSRNINSQCGAMAALLGGLGATLIYVRRQHRKLRKELRADLVHAWQHEIPQPTTIDPASMRALRDALAVDMYATLTAATDRALRVGMVGRARAGAPVPSQVGNVLPIRRG